MRAHLAIFGPKAIVTCIIGLGGLFLLCASGSGCIGSAITSHIHGWLIVVVSIRPPHLLAVLFCISDTNSALIVDVDVLVGDLVRLGPRT